MLQDFKEMLCKSLEDEQKDIKKYKDLSQIAEKNECYELAGVLNDICEDEISHAEMLKYFLDK